ncbi:MAG: cytochrome c [Verrucomicrobia bacterium]|nr:cytochrome c [Verrucomicrobiota bacterium]
MMHRRLRLALVVSGFLVLSLTPLTVQSDEAEEKPAQKEPEPVAPAVPTNTGLLLEPPLDLSDFTYDQFVEMMSSVGPEKIRKPWTSPVVTLPKHPRADAKGLTADEVTAYMMQTKTLFDEGKAIPVSDVGLISTQEDVIRRPMLNHISGFVNDVVRVYLLVQKTSSDQDWGYYSIVQDLTVDPALDYYAHIKESGPHFEGQSCYKCHSSGPLAIHPTREDLVLDAALNAAFNQHIAEQPRSRPHFLTEQPEDHGEPLTLKFCARCHTQDEDGDRAALFQTHSHPIRVLVDFGYMPPNRRLKPEEIAELKAWLEEKP